MSAPHATKQLHGARVTVFRDKPELLLAFRRGDRAALETVYRHYVQDVSRILRLGFTSGTDLKLRVPGLRDQQALRDAIQEVFTRALDGRARARYDGVRPYRPLLLQIARNLRIDQLRSGMRELPMSSLPESDGSIDIDQLIERNLPLHPSEDPEPQGRREWQALQSYTQRYVAGLDDEARRFVQLRFAESGSQAEVAEAMGVSRRRVRTLEVQVMAGLSRFLERCAKSPNGG